MDHLLSKKIIQIRKEAKKNANSLLFANKRLKFQAVPVLNVNQGFFLGFLEEVKAKMASCDWGNKEINDMIRNGSLLSIIKGLENENEKEVYECAYIISNILSQEGQIIDICISNGVIKSFLHILQTKDDIFKEQILWGLANLSASSDTLPLLLSSPLLSLLLSSLCQYPSNSEIKSNILWCLNNILRPTKIENYLKMKDFDLIFEILENILGDTHRLPTFPPPLTPLNLPPSSFPLPPPSHPPFSPQFIFPNHPTSSPSPPPPPSPYPPPSLSSPPHPPSPLPPPNIPSPTFSPPHPFSTDVASSANLSQSSNPSFLLEILSCLDAVAKRFVSQTLAKKIIVDYFGIVKGVVERIEEVKEEKGIQYFLNFICFLTIDCDDQEIESLVAINVDKKVMTFIRELSPKIRKSVYTTMGNMMASNSNIIFQIFSKNPLIAISIFDTIQNDTNFNVKKEAIICLSNMVSLATNDILCELIDMKIVEAVCSILDIYDPDLLLILLDILQEFIKLGFFIQEEESSKSNIILDLILKCRGEEKLEVLSANSNFKIQERSIAILKMFDGEEMILE